MVLNGTESPPQEYENDEMSNGSVSNNFVDIRGATPGMSPNNSSSQVNICYKQFTRYYWWCTY